MQVRMREFGIMYEWAHSTARTIPKQDQFFLTIRRMREKMKELLLLFFYNSFTINYKICASSKTLYYFSKFAFPTGPIRVELLPKSRLNGKLMVGNAIGWADMFLLCKYQKLHPCAWQACRWERGGENWTITRCCQ